jgi:hypothetical protein
VGEITAQQEWKMERLWRAMREGRSERAEKEWREMRRQVKNQNGKIKVEAENRRMEMLAKVPQKVPVQAWKAINKIRGTGIQEIQALVDEGKLLVDDEDLLGEMRKHYMKIGGAGKEKQRGVPRGKWRRDMRGWSKQVEDNLNNAI